MIRIPAFLEKALLAVFPENGWGRVYRMLCVFGGTPPTGYPGMLLMSAAWLALLFFGLWALRRFILLCVRFIRGDEQTETAGSDSEYPADFLAYCATARILEQIYVKAFLCLLVWLTAWFNCRVCAANDRGMYAHYVGLGQTFFLTAAAIYLVTGVLYAWVQEKFNAYIRRTVVLPAVYDTLAEVMPEQQARMGQLCFESILRRFMCWDLRDKLAKIAGKTPPPDGTAYLDALLDEIDADILLYPLLTKLERANLEAVKAAFRP